MENVIKTPQLRVCVTTQCNLKCRFCRAGGEGYAENLEQRLTSNEIRQVLNTTKEIGFECVKFTGGEPLLREDIMDLIKYARGLGFKDVQLVTNGTLLEQRIPELKEVGLDLLTVSLDAINADVYEYMRGHAIAPVLDAIKRCSEEGIAVRINMIVIKSNFDQLKPMIEFARNTNCSLKLLDLIRLPGIEEFWEKEYLNFNEVRKLLDEIGGTYIGKEEAPGGIGAPLSEYRTKDGCQIVIKDSTQGTFYHETCNDCKNYPCQDALISVRVTHDGNLKRCLIRNDNLVDLRTVMKSNDTQAVIDTLRETFTIMTESKYEPFKWIPPVVSI